MDRRHFLNVMAGTGLSVMAAPHLLKAAGSHYDVIVVGGGMAGATVAKYLKLWSNGAVSVALIEKEASYTSNIMSNMVITGQRTLSSLNYGYSTLTSNYGIERITGNVSAISATNKTVTYAYSSGGSSGFSTLSYGRLVLAPGLEFDLMPGMSSLNEYDTLTPHAWRAGPQTQLLRNQLLALPDGQPVVITIPLAPFRCPPGPYERACVIADWLKVNKPNSQLVVLDANPDIIVEKENFSTAFSGAHGYVVNYQPGCTVTHVNSASKSVTYTKGGTSYSITSGVLNPIPPQRAPALLDSAGLLSGGFAPVNVLSFESTLKPGIHVIGDASKTTLPKAGHVGNQEAKTCADAILRAMAGASPDPAPVMNSACYTPVTSTKATWLSAVYQYDPSQQKMIAATRNYLGVSYAQPIAAGSATADNYQDMLIWFNTLMRDTFA